MCKVFSVFFFFLAEICTLRKREEEFLRNFAISHQIYVHIIEKAKLFKNFPYELNNDVICSLSLEFEQTCNQILVRYLVIDLFSKNFGKTETGQSVSLSGIVPCAVEETDGNEVTLLLSQLSRL